MNKRQRNEEFKKAERKALLGATLAGAGLVAKAPVQQAIGQHLVDNVPIDINEEEFNKIVNDFRKKEKMDFIAVNRGPHRRGIYNSHLYPSHLIFTDKIKKIMKKYEIEDSFLKSLSDKMGYDEDLLRKSYNEGKPIVSSFHNEAVLRHELGHLKNTKAAVKMGDTGRLAYLLNARIGPKPLAIAMASKTVRDKMKKNKVTRPIAQFAEDHPLISSYIGMNAGLLGEEGLASARALNGMRKAHGFKSGVLRGMKTLAPAYGTYVAQGLPGAAIVGGKIIYDNYGTAKKRHQEKTASDMIDELYKEAGLKEVAKKIFDKANDTYYKAGVHYTNASSAVSKTVGDKIIEPMAQSAAKKGDKIMASADKTAPLADPKIQEAKKHYDRAGNLRKMKDGGGNFIEDVSKAYQPISDPLTVAKIQLGQAIFGK